MNNFHLNLRKSLGSYHDGVSNPAGYSQCSAEKNNIMTPFGSVWTQYTANNINQFSNCSINGFKLNLLSNNLK